MTLVMVEPFLKLSRSTTLEVFNNEAVWFRLGAEEMPTTAGVASLLARLLCLYVKVVSFYLSVSVRPKSFLTVIFRLAYGVFPSASVGRVKPSRARLLFLHRFYCAELSRAAPVMDLLRSRAEPAPPPDELQPTRFFKASPVFLKHLLCLTNSSCSPSAVLGVDIGDC